MILEGRASLRVHKAASYEDYCEAVRMGLPARYAEVKDGMYSEWSTMTMLECELLTQYLEESWRKRSREGQDS